MAVAMKEAVWKARHADYATRKKRQERWTRRVVINISFFALKILFVLARIATNLVALLAIASFAVIAMPVN